MSKKSIVPLADLRTVVVASRGHTYFFVYRDGDEEAVLNAAIAAVENRGLLFDWCDAATVAHEVGKLASKPMPGVKQ